MHFIVSFALLFAVTIGSQNKTFPRVVFRGTVLPNHSYVPFARVGHDQTDNGVECHIDLATCCNVTHGNPAGAWYFPNSNRLTFDQLRHTYMRRLLKKIVLYQRQGETAKDSGIYHCAVPTNSSSPDEKGVYVGIYNDDGGKKTKSSLCTYMLYLAYQQNLKYCPLLILCNLGDLQMTHDITFNLAWEIAVDVPIFTLTCTSTGGPATADGWFRNSTNISGGITMLSNTVI